MIPRPGCRAPLGLQRAQRAIHNKGPDLLLQCQKLHCANFHCTTNRLFSDTERNRVVCVCTELCIRTLPPAHRESSEGQSQGRLSRMFFCHFQFSMAFFSLPWRELFIAVSVYRFLTALIVFTSAPMIYQAEKVGKTFQTS